MEYIIGIINDSLLGIIAKPFVIHKEKDKGFYPIEAQISELNIQKYENQLTEEQLKIFHLSQEYSETNLFRLFKSKKDKNNKDFISRLKKEDADQKIRPFIEKRLTNNIDILRTSNI